MLRRPRIRWQPLLAQAAVIILSILLAFAVDAWWATRLAADREHGHLCALQRDFEIARERVRTSLETARRGQSESLELFLAIQRGDAVSLGRPAYLSMLTTIGYEVFSAPRGAYDTMVSAGEVELLQSQPLKQSLADFYGGFEDTRVSERQLLEAVLRFQTSDVFAQKVNWSEIGYSTLRPEAPLSDRDRELMATWKGDRQLTNWLCALSAHHDTVAEDYVFLSERIESILAALATELSRT